MSKFRDCTLSFPHMFLSSKQLTVKAYHLLGQGSLNHFDVKNNHMSKAYGQEGEGDVVSIMQIIIIKFLSLLFEINVNLLWSILFSLASLKCSFSFFSRISCFTYSFKWSWVLLFEIFFFFFPFSYCVLYMNQLAFLCPLLSYFLIFIKLILHRIDLSFYTIVYVFSDKLPLYRMQLLFGLIYFCICLAQLVLYSAFLPFVYFIEFLFFVT